jgi:ATP-binding cassette subfamily C protein
VSQALGFLRIENLTFQNQVSVLGIMAVLVLVIRTVTSIYFTRRILKFLGRRSADLSNDLFARLMYSPLVTIEKRSRQETIYSLTLGIYTLSIGVLGILIMIISDIALLAMIFIGLAVVDFKIALATLVLFGVTGTVLFILLHKKAAVLGQQNSRIDIQSQELLNESLSAYKEIKTRNAETYYVHKFSRLRLGLSEVLAELAFLPNISKYVIEATLILGGFAICALQFATEDASRAVATLAVFLAAGTRIAPSVLRIQQNLVFIRSNIATSLPSLALIAELKGVEVPNIDMMSAPEVLEPSIDIKEVFFSYTDKDFFQGITLKVEPGTFVGIVGPSGSGKSTFMNLILGVLKPKSGEVKISEITAEVFYKKWPGKLAYVPQEIVIVGGTIRSNLTLGLDSESVSDEQIWESLELAQLSEYVRTLDGKLNAEVGELGAKLSGGQRQRLGIARALLLRPEILLLDEATSSLDGITENEIATSLEKLRGKLTLVVIAHRMSTLKRADKVYFLKAGRIEASGTLDELKQTIPEIELQASLLSF